MTDIIDEANDYAEKETEASLATIRKAASDFQQGVPGWCEYCGERFERIIKNACGKCRDEFKIK